MPRTEAPGRLARPEPAADGPTRRVARLKPAELAPQVVDLERCVPAFLSWIANKLSRGASQHCLSVADVGIETWRCLVLLAIEGLTDCWA